MKESKKEKPVEKVHKAKSSKKISKKPAASKINTNFIVLSKRSIKPTQKMLDSVE